MARTIRRKNATFNYDWVLAELIRVEDSYRYEWVPVDRHSPEGRKKLAHYRSDAGSGRYVTSTAPHWYRRSRNKKASNIEKQHLHRWKKAGDDQYEVPKLTRVSDASWYW